MKSKIIILLAVTLACSSKVGAQTIKVGTADGGSVVTELGFGVKVNKNSTLHRTWVVFNDETCPMQLSGVGITTKYGERDYRFVPVGVVQASEPISAFEVRYLLYDVFGEHIKTLSGTEVTDLPANKPLDLKDIGSWNAWETEVSGLLTVVAFVALVRTTAGKVWRYQEKLIDEELSNIRLKVSTGVLEPSKEKK